MDQRVEIKRTRKHGLYSHRYWFEESGNKCDRDFERVVKQEEAIELAHQNKLYYL